MSAAGQEFLHKEEGLRLKAYYDSRGVLTIGFGNTYYPNGKKVKVGDKITLSKAREIFQIVLKHYELCVYSVTRNDINQNQFDALVSLCYNIGTGAFKGSTVLRRVNLNPNDKTIASAFKMWRNAGKKKGILLGRRIREAELYFKK